MHLLVLIFVSIILSCNQSNTKQKEFNLKEKELSLSEKELQLKENGAIQDTVSSTKNSTEKSGPITELSDYNFDNHDKIKFFIDDLAKAVSSNDKSTITQMINFPFVDEYGDNSGNQSTPLGCKTMNRIL